MPKQMMFGSDAQQGFLDGLGKLAHAETHSHFVILEVLDPYCGPAQVPGRSGAWQESPIAARSSHVSATEPERSDWVPVPLHATLHVTLRRTLWCPS